MCQVDRNTYAKMPGAWCIRQHSWNAGLPFMLCDWVLVCSSKWSGTHYRAHAGLNLMAILLLLSSKYQGYRCVLLCLVSLYFSSASWANFSSSSEGIWIKWCCAYPRPSTWYGALTGHLVNRYHLSLILSPPSMSLSSFSELSHKSSPSSGTAV